MVGIFQTCANQTTRTALNVKADVCKQVTELTFSYNGIENRSDIWIRQNIPYDLGENNFTVTTYDICSREELLQTVSDLLLDKRFFVSNQLQDPPKWNGNVIDRWQFEQSVLYLVVYLSEELTKLIDEIMSTADIRMIVTNPYQRQVKEPVTRAKTRLTSKAIELLKDSKQIFHRVVIPNETLSLTVVMFVEPKSHYVHLAMDFVRSCLLYTSPSPRDS